MFLSSKVWQHFDCMRLETEVEHYLCELCDPRPVDRVRTATIRDCNVQSISSPASLIPSHVLLSQEVPMIPQPSYAQAGSVYYICLLRDDLLLHQGKHSLETCTRPCPPEMLAGGRGG